MFRVGIRRRRTRCVSITVTGGIEIGTEVVVAAVVAVVGGRRMRVDARRLAFPTGLESAARSSVRVCITAAAARDVVYRTNRRVLLLLLCDENVTRGMM